MKKIIGINFLHAHPYKEVSLGLDGEHVIVDKEDWWQVVDYFRSNPEVVNEIGAKRGVTFTEDIQKATEKQLNYIGFIQDTTGIPFSGTTLEEASNYIDQNKDKVPATAMINDWAIENGY